MSNGLVDFRLIDPNMPAKVGTSWIQGIQQARQDTAQELQNQMAQQQYQNALAEAKKLDPENPRITIMEAEDLYFTPEQFGGSKAKGIELFKKALEQFKTYKLKSSLDPNWGQGEANYFISQAK